MGIALRRARDTLAQLLQAAARDGDVSVDSAAEHGDTRGLHVANNLVRLVNLLVPLAFGNLHHTARTRDQVRRHAPTLEGRLAEE